MNTIKLLSYFLAIAFSATAAAKVTIEVPDTIDLLVVDGAKPSNSGSLFSSTTNIELEDGQHQIVFRFEPSFTQGNELGVAESDVVIAKFSANDQNLTFSLPEYRDIDAAKKDIKKFEWTLVDQHEQSIEIQQDRLLKQGMQLGRNYPQETLEYNQTGAVAAVSGGTSAMPVGSTAEEMLLFWYNKADEQTKDRFKAYIKAQ